jgi:hypothetical protein
MPRPRDSTSVFMPERSGYDVRAEPEQSLQIGWPLFEGIAHGSMMPAGRSG